MYIYATRVIETHLSASSEPGTYVGCQGSKLGTLADAVGSFQVPVRFISRDGPWEDGTTRTCISSGMQPKFQYIFYVLYTNGRGPGPSAMWPQVLI